MAGGGKRVVSGIVKATDIHAVYSRIGSVAERLRNRTGQRQMGAESLRVANLKE